MHKKKEGDIEDTTSSNKSSNTNFFFFFFLNTSNTTFIITYFYWCIRKAVTAELKVTQIKKFHLSKLRKIQNFCYFISLCILVPFAFHNKMIQQSSNPKLPSNI